MGLLQGRCHPNVRQACNESGQTTPAPDLQPGPSAGNRSYWTPATSLALSAPTHRIAQVTFASLTIPVS